MNISQDKIAEVVERTDIVALVSKYVPLKKAGRNYVACCPFHSEKTPSFSVNPSRNFFYCFGCHTGGDAIAFVRKYLGKTFLEAVEELAREAGIAIDRTDDPGTREREELRRVNELASRHYQAHLWDERRGRTARDHLEKRGVAIPTAKAFGLGYALPEWNDFAMLCAKEGVLDFAARAGLCAPRKGGDGYYDVFRGRLIVPIRSPEGRALALAGRHLVGMPNEPGDREPAKYVNSRESRIYVKGEVLYGLDVAKDAIRTRKSAILVEGYFDCIGLHQAGVANAVALCSTALTEQHLKLLGRMDAKEIVLFFDGDEAGSRAVERLAPAILGAGVTARVAVCPAGKDPDEFAVERGGPAVEELVGAAAPLTEHLLRQALPKGRAAGWEDRVRAVRSLRPVIEAMPEKMEKSMFVDKLAEHVGAPASEVRAALASSPPRRPAPAPAAPAPAGHAGGRADRLEELVCALLVADPALGSLPEAEVLDQMRDLGLRTVAAAGGAADDVLATASAEVRERVERGLVEVRAGLAESEARRLAFQRAARDLRLARVDERIGELRAEVSAHEDLTDEALPLHTELQQLTQERVSLLRTTGISRTV